MRLIDKICLIILPPIVVVTTYLILPMFLSYLDPNYIVYINLMVISIQLIFFSYLLLRLRGDNLSILDIWKREMQPRSKILFYGVLFFLISSGLIFLMLWIYSIIYPYYPKQTLNPFNVILMIVVVPIVAGVTEESIWRAYDVWELYEELDSKWLAIFIQAVAFGFFHGFDPIKVPIIFVIGVIAGFIMLKIKNAYPLIVAHILLDVWSMFYYFI